MPRELLDPPTKSRTTLDISTTLLNHLKVHTALNDEKLGDFITRALVNQLEIEGDIDIRFILEREVFQFGN